MGIRGLKFIARQARMDAADLFGGEFRQKEMWKLRFAGDLLGFIYGTADQGSRKLSAKLTGKARIHGLLHATDEVGQ